jgi:hypothetical protein
MGYLLGVLGSIAAVGYHILFDRPRQPEPAVWSAWDWELIAMYALAGFAVGWVVAFAIGRVGREK